ncbi:MAG: glycosyl hydrolase [Saprospiraceae bacterium]
MKKLFTTFVFCLFSVFLYCQGLPINESTFSGFKLRNVGPAFTSGRIADIAIHPINQNIWYVAVGSGGVWKTENSGTTWKPIFDDQSVYSTGCITLDPQNPNVIWLGTGENVGGRHVGFGDGIYKSEDGGKTWKNMGLSKSEHLSEIIIHPKNSNIIWVASQGPLWSKGGERGLFKSTDGGKSWKRTLGNNKWTGVTDLVIDPRDPDLLYAATWDRHRTVAAYMGGGAGSGIHRSTDGGNTWTKLTKGIPKSNLGKIGLAISPQHPDEIYAAIELDRTKGGIFKSWDRGSSWSKQSDAISGATGPHYYQELYADPHIYDKIYLANNRIIVSDNGGKDYYTMSENKKHSDNHDIAFTNDSNFMMVGSDGGLYVTHDNTKHWRFIDNMPITQYYKVALDDREPFYHIYGGTQDNGSHGGPSQTDNEHGIRNADWYKTLGADGHQSATEPGNPNILYAESQQGVMHRVDLATGEQIRIQPTDGEGENYERYNWDAPIIVSPHNPARIYFASQRVWQSENRGDSWTAISKDLTKNQDRITLPIMGRVQGWDNPWDVRAMSNYNSITSLSESPIKEGLLYAGTDDGIIQVTNDGGANWTKINVNKLPNVPATAFVNDIKADLHDVNTVYASLDNHKNGDFSPYIYKSTDKGRTWRSIKSNLPNKTLVWRLVQDHVDPQLLFIATEFGIYFSQNCGGKWIKLKGSPTISFRDLAIQKRENDLVGASFGRSFFVLDNYAPLRSISTESLKKDAALYPIQDADWYIPRSIIGSEGHQHYAADNPEFGAVFTYHINKEYKSIKDKREEKEKKLNKGNQNIPFPGWDALDNEKNEKLAKIWLVIIDSDGEIVRKIKAKKKKGVHRTSWDLRYAGSRTITPGRAAQSVAPWMRRSMQGHLAAPGTYAVSLIEEHEGNAITLAGPESFNVVPLREGTLSTGGSPEEYSAFSKRLRSIRSIMSSVAYDLNHSLDVTNAMLVALDRTTSAPGSSLSKEIFATKSTLNGIQKELRGSSAKGEMGERNNTTLQSRYFQANAGISTSYGPTANHEKSLKIIENQIPDVKRRVDEIVNNIIPALIGKLKDIGAPYIQGF